MVKLTLSNRDKIVDKKDLKESNSKKDTFETIDELSLETLNSLKEDRSPATPTNYGIYFEKALELKDDNIQKDIDEILNLDIIHSLEDSFETEKYIKENITQVKNILRTISVIYEKTNIMKKITQKKKEDISVDYNKFSLLSFEEDLENFNNILRKQLLTIKESYNKSISSIKEIENRSIYDHKYEIFNKNYFLKALTNEIKSINKFSHESIVFAIKVDNKLLDSIKFKKDRAIIIKLVSKMLLKSLRKNDIVAHYKDDVFVCLLKYSDIEDAKNICDRIYNAIHSTKVVLNFKEITVDVKIAISRLNPNLEPEKIINSLLEKLSLSKNEPNSYIISE